ncbi:hypothetical protein [Vreelandella aquamarina]|uniref:Uncharacterized protein n=1 Tax=Vreelandella aquamarina TaxID=77097 RepID=A0A857GL58_9GAMM|nr:hypothetical protein [Halomonas meridiana]QHD50009.1 hypothetical protein CTT34_10060 [Halomonas meridiana]
MTQRDRFEAWAVAPPREWPIDKQPNSPRSAWPGQYVAHYVQCAWEAWQAACPEGYVAIPTKADEAMERAYSHDYHDSAQSCHDAVIAAAPKPEDV